MSRFPVHAPSIGLRLLLALAILVVAGEVPAAESAGTLRYARMFSVEPHAGYTVLRVRKARSGGEFTYLVLRLGVSAPAGHYDAVIHAPVARIASLSSAYLPFIARLGAAESVVAVDSASGVDQPAIAAGIAEGRVATVGREATFRAEKAMLSRPDLVLSFGDNTIPQPLVPLAQAGVAVVATAEYREPLPLGYAEWIKFFGVLLDREAQADAIFARIADRYEKLKALAASAGRAPSVLSGGNYQGTWFVPAPDSYTANLLRDAGARYVFAGVHAPRALQTSMMPLTFEAVVRKAAQADYWIDAGPWPSRAAALAEDSRYALFDAFRDGRVYENTAQTTPSGANAYWSRGLASPDQLLADLIRILHPALLAGHDIAWYQRLDHD
jgi:iron complex transport system substrate-binding protein